MEKVILVNEKDEAIGEMEKLEAHQKGLLHRAFSVFIFNSKNELLLQRRALDKYHSPGLWTNTCCSHPRPGESILEAANRRLNEEMGIATNLEHKGSFIYKAEFDNGLTEHELDHIVIGCFNEDPNINPEEVDSFKWLDLESVKTDLEQNPHNYTVWFREIINQNFTSFTDQA
ncbi:MAG: isopentenyl-diphosphate Delta-isomerase [Bacteroidia bacterium]